MPLTTAENVLWLIGISASILCLLIQIFLYVLLPSSRKLDQKILTQMTVARLLNVIIEYTIFNIDIYSQILRAAVIVLYLQTDAALIFWMFIFTKNLYDKVTVVFTTKINFVLVSILVWIFSFLLGILNPILVHYNIDQAFFYGYSIVKFIILTVNVLFLGRVLFIAIKRKLERNVTGVLRTCFVGFMLLFATSLQVFLTDLTSLVTDLYKLMVVFSIINSYEPVVMTILFVILVNACTEDSMFKTIQDRFYKMRA